MYIPGHFKENDRSKILDYIHNFPFGMLLKMDITNRTILHAHLPFICQVINNKIQLIGHAAAQNPVIKDFYTTDSDLVQVVFQSASGYINPKWYKSEINVPTWNYIAIDMTGTISLITNQEDKINILEKTIKRFDEQFIPQWNELPSNYLDALYKELVGFQIDITEYKANFKLSQNKSKEEQKNIAQNLQESELMESKILSQLMLKYNHE